MSFPIQNLQAKDRLIFALDTPHLESATYYVKVLNGLVGVFKVGLELFIKEGPIILQMIKENSDAKIFLDLKLHDIPATVRGGLRSAVDHEIEFITVHCSGGEAMLRTSQQALDNLKVLGVTVLTNLNKNDLSEEQGYRSNINTKDLVMARAHLAKQCGCSGIVCSGEEVGEVKRRFGKDFLTVVPGIRPQWSVVEKDDQSRIVTPESAIQLGADYLVVGRPIRDASDPGVAAKKVVKEIFEALKTFRNSELPH